MEENLKILLSSLSWSCTEEEQSKAIFQLVQFKEKLFDCLITESGKDKWENCIKIISQFEYQDKVKMIPQMLFLLKDMNWPGAIESVNLMLGMESEDLAPSIINALEEAVHENDTIWIAWLKEFIVTRKLKLLLEEYSEVLKLAEW
ncbi:DUF5071 domain-containing protein [Paenibacillus sp. LHD-117]|uniref:DUF5071 domain-containing protein n=1 Tax=Paenibacillus sp. LHD-117 TaxID=3071412 RepID=UPI0027DFD547|nr:DUF5071 domain-containing protein [Paenibacillus sp. LHD-117]MDQ6421773.1 DUF5071 domain-containing protein [Paenibacillus sp. LHD-117]